MKLTLFDLQILFCVSYLCKFLCESLVFYPCIIIVCSINKLIKLYKNNHLIQV